MKEQSSTFEVYIDDVYYKTISIALNLLIDIIECKSESIREFLSPQFEIINKHFTGADMEKAIGLIMQISKMTKGYTEISTSDDLKRARGILEAITPNSNIEINDDDMRFLGFALDSMTRMAYGQIAYSFDFFKFKFEYGMNNEEEYYKIIDKIHSLEKKYCNALLGSMGPGRYLGVGSRYLAPYADEAYTLYKSIRNALAWHRNPTYDWMNNDYDPVIKYGTASYIPVFKLIPAQAS
jgi:hypothetical protein